MRQIQKARRHRGPAGGRHEPLAIGPRDPDIVHACLIMQVIEA